MTRMHVVHVLLYDLEGYCRITSHDTDPAAARAADGGPATRVPPHQVLGFRVARLGGAGKVCLSAMLWLATFYASVDF